MYNFKLGFALEKNKRLALEKKKSGRFCTPGSHMHMVVLFVPMEHAEMLKMAVLLLKMKTRTITKTKDFISNTACEWYFRME